MSVKLDVIHVDIPDKEILYQSYMPFVEGGGLFIPSTLSVHMGLEISLLATLPERPQHIALNGKVIWLAQKQNALKPKGFAIQLMGEAGIYYRTEAEKLLRGFKANTQTSYTM